MIGRDDFGPALRRMRERRGITLEAIAEATKISATLFASMERNDFSRWPDGLFRRSFLRAYAEAIGADAERTVNEYLRLFHGIGEAAAPDASTPRARFSPMRSLAAVAVAWLTALRARVVRLFPRPAARPAAPPATRRLTKHLGATPAHSSRRHRRRRADRRRPRA